MRDHSFARVKAGRSAPAHWRCEECGFTLGCGPTPPYERDDVEDLRREIPECAGPKKCACLEGRHCDVAHDPAACPCEQCTRAEGRAEVAAPPPYQET